MEFVLNIIVSLFAAGIWCLLASFISFFIEEGICHIKGVAKLQVRASIFLLSLAVTLVGVTVLLGLLWIMSVFTVKIVQEALKIIGG